MFLDTLRIEALNKRDLTDQNVQLYRVEAPFRFRSKAAAAIGTPYREITVPAGFVTDFASIPDALHNLIDDDSPCILYPSVVHDFLYSAESTATCVVEREVADRVLIEGMTECQAPKWKRKAVYYAVRLFGGSHWRT